MLKTINKGIQIYKDIKARSNIIEREGPFFSKDNIEQRVREERLRIADPEVAPFQNDKPAFAIVKINLILFNYWDLKEIFYSVHNLMLPDLMLMNQNEAEILATYLGSNKIKTDKHRHLRLCNQSFEDIIRIIDQEGYKNPAILTLQYNGFKPHSIKKGDKQKRFNLMPPSVKRLFLASFSQPLKKPVHMDKYNGYFYDPNCDGHSKRIYVDAIYKYFKMRSESIKKNV
ncbi:MAG: hypothetical protein AB1571_01185 [Nanoarchaeota archaeon]